MGSRWGFALTASTADLRHLERQVCTGGTRDRTECEAFSDHTVTAWSNDSLVLVALIGAGFLGAWLSVRRMDVAGT